MKKTIFCLFALLAVVLSSCGNKGAERMLQTIPAGSSYLSVLNAENITSKLGNEGLAQWDALVSQGFKGSDDRWKFLLGKDSGIDFSTPVFIFEYKGANVITFEVKDSGAFREGFEKAASAKFTGTGNLYYLPDNTAFVNDKQVWLTAAYPEVKPEDIKTLLALKKADSMASLKYAVEMSASDDDCSTFASLASLIKQSGNIGGALYLNTLFNSPEYLVYKTNFEKEAIVGSLTVLNAKFEPSACAFKPSKLDVSTIKDFKGKGNVFFAIGIDPQLTTQLLDKFKALLPLPAEGLAMLKNIDGDILLSGSLNDNMSNPALSGALISFKTKEAAEEASQVVKELGLSPIQNAGMLIEGNALCLLAPEQSGNSPAEMASWFKDAGMGFLCFTSAFKGEAFGNIGNYILGVAAKLVDNGDGVSLDFNVDTKKGQNSLISIMQFVSQK